MAQELSFVVNLISHTDKLPETILMSFVRVKLVVIHSQWPSVLPLVHLCVSPSATSHRYLSLLAGRFFPLGDSASARPLPIVGLTCFAAVS